MPNLHQTNLEVSNLCFGGNVFGWTADQDQSFALLNRFTELGGNFIDTADVYSAWKEGNQGGEPSRRMRGFVSPEWIGARI
jgi:aryl-alcohol dehydrogenase-like predicted oxidoreductase